MLINYLPSSNSGRSGHHEGELRVFPVKSGHSTGTAQVKVEEVKISSGLTSKDDMDTISREGLQAHNPWANASPNNR
ncbi:hypothetical protein T265_12291 [Opisthorchis viverrini]|uniref:Uncharacterized protein n=1 Tax=Opisthorchis viverrini TaxID=6198 RepID=A0A074YUI9_OPIVI|nr:hypothetical protein T265_12291 [Opisthorchis viverrini]KER18373.1 hypothetical protein T265_12291 [Opisthorchis viverrini]